MSQETKDRVVEIVFRIFLASVVILLARVILFPLR